MNGPVNPDELKREWIDLAPAWIREAREGVNPTRTGLLDRPMLPNFIVYALKKPALQ